MLRLALRQPWLWMLTLALIFSGSGCTSCTDYFRNGCKVGPNYCVPCATAAPHWIDSADARVREQTEDISHWWTAFNDPTLNRLVTEAYEQNLTLRQAGFRILEARATYGIAVGNILPQSQFAAGSYRRSTVGPKSFETWGQSFSLSWELDFWGRFRRAAEAADDLLEASVASYDDVLVTLISDVATNYVQIRTDQERIKLLKENVEIQKLVLEVGKRRLKAGAIGELDIEQANSILKQTLAAIPAVEIDQRLANNRLCILLGMPPEKLDAKLGLAKIPTAANDVAVGIPYDLLRRRPDVRRAERDAAAQAEAIGIAQAQYYPAFSITGTLGWQASSLTRLYTSDSFTGSVGPQFHWDILNYCRIRNNVRLQDAKFQELALAYEQTVLVANGEAENGLIVFLKSQERTANLAESVKSGRTARDIALTLYERGEKGFDYNRYATIEQNLISQQDQLAQSQGQIALGLIQVYKALGGGWEIRCESGPSPTSASPFSPLPNDSASPLPGTESKPPEKKPEEIAPPKIDLPQATPATQIRFVMPSS